MSETATPRPTEGGAYEITADGRLVRASEAALPAAGDPAPAEPPAPEAARRHQPRER